MLQAHMTDWKPVRCRPSATDGAQPVPGGPAGPSPPWAQVRRPWRIALSWLRPGGGRFILPRFG